ncbi:MAG: kynureninase [Planctomycetaceae bacterium]
MSRSDPILTRRLPLPPPRMLEMPVSSHPLDEADPLAPLREQFYLPPGKIYFDGNSLGLLCRSAERAVHQALEEWKTDAIEGWTTGQPGWFHLVEQIADQLCRITHAPPGSLTLTGSTTLHLHQVLATLYRPDERRPGILLDQTAFPTDRYAVASFLRSRGLDPARHLIELPTDREGLVPESDLDAAFRQGVQLAVLPSVVFTTGQLLDLTQVTAAAAAHDVRLCWDCSHSVGVVPLDLATLRPDAAIWCTYKYLNGGPGSVAALYLDPRWNALPPGLAGWFGADKSRQFRMEPDLVPAEGAGRLQLGSPHVLSLAALRGSLEVVEAAGVDRLRRKSLELTRYLRGLIQERLGGAGFGFATPQADERRGGHLAIRHPLARGLSVALRARGFVPDYREPDLLRIAPSPLYSRFADCDQLVAEIDRILADGTDLASLSGSLVS